MNSKAALQGILAGIAGVAVMTLGEKLEQLITKRPNSYMPAHTLEHLLGRSVKSDNLGLNWAMHFGQGILLGAVRGLMAEKGIRCDVQTAKTLDRTPRAGHRL